MTHAARARTTAIVAAIAAMALLGGGCASISRAAQRSVGLQSAGSVLEGPSLSPDGRFVAFLTEAGLVSRDTNGYADHYIHDRNTGVAERVSIGAAGAAPNGASGGGEPDVSNDGRFVAFGSSATNLDPNCPNAAPDVYVRDRIAGTTECISVTSGEVEGNGHSIRPHISGNGRFVVFQSFATNLVLGDTNFPATDIFVRDRQSGTTERVSVSSTEAQSSGSSSRPDISRDGRYVAFLSDGADLTSTCAAATGDQVYVRDRHAGTTECVSLDRNGGPSNSSAEAPVLSAQGAEVAFASAATDLDPACASAIELQTYVRDLDTDTTTCVSLDDDGGVSDGYAKDPELSGDGRYVTFGSDGNHMAPGCPIAGGANPEQTLRHDRDTGAAICISVDTGGLAANGSSTKGAPITDNGATVAFTSLATDLVEGDTNGVGDVFVRDDSSGVTTRVSNVSVQPDAETQSPVLSTDGRYLVFASSATNLVPGDTNGVGDVFRKDQLTGEIVRVSVGPASAQADAESRLPSVSGQGRYIAFESDATNLVPADTNGVADVFVRDVQLGITVRASMMASIGALLVEGNLRSGAPDISSDGRYVAFESDATNTPTACQWPGSDVFVRDLLGGTSCPHALGAWDTENPSISGAGRYVALEVVLGPCPTPFEVAVWDSQTGAVSCFGSGHDPDISENGTHVAFTSHSTTLDPRCANGFDHVFLIEIATAAAECISVDPSGAAATDVSDSASVSADASHVAFRTMATNLDPDATDFNNAGDVMVRDRDTDRTFRLSTDLFFAPANGPSDGVAISPDDSLAAFGSDATNLADGDTLGVRDVFLRSTRRVEASTGAPLQLARGATVTRTLNGHGFRADTAVTVEGTGDVTVDAVTFVSPTRLRLTLTATLSASTGRRALTVINYGPAWNPNLGALDICDCLDVT